jgi:hypothetical protein
MKVRWRKFIENDPYYNTNLTLEAQDFGLQSADEVLKKYSAQNSN